MNLNKTSRKIYVGVHVKQNVIRKMRKQRVGRNIKRLQKANEFAKTELYFFGDTDVKLNQKVIRGMYFNKKSKRWERKWFPYPDVFYNRRVSKLMKNTKVERIRNTFDRLGIPKINSQHYFDKWDVYLKLKQYKELRPHLPETVFYRNRNDLSRMVRESRRLFLKSLTQNNGLGIFIVTKRRKGFQYSYYKRKKLSRGYVSTFNSLLKKIRQFFKNKPFIIQKSINLIRVNNKVADLRCDVQRNGQDEIECVAHSVRIGVKNSPITNTRTKPTIYPFDRFLIHKMGYTRKQVKDKKTQLESLLLTIFKKIEESYGRFGEMGIDIGIDQGGNLWIIECNAKPGKNSMWVLNKKTIDRAFLNPLQYAKLLAERKD